MTQTNQAKPLNKNNYLMLRYLEQVEKAVKRLNEMGLTVINVHFEKIKPTVRVMTNSITDRLEREQKAYVYHVGRDNGRYQEAQFSVEGIRVIWRKYLQ
ncbi:hypothetical protein BKK54_06520 [Rodentibacter genomosp. 1]|uniref:Uncharacterized protein n=1 Tax=Rodentibacter genomosp. 1 TaxID=1908264 RepID=A0A1V3J5I0_9PAST|nr:MULTISPECIES: hypothetical protein [Rodentibacter]OOF50297.1 hypothetical protein BKK54_06520 [Rodentibacter genomosp. 1]OOF65195.1 hypothetical protein BH925_05035 [Rodentibacter pneumotropicus]